MVGLLLASNTVTDAWSAAATAFAAASIGASYVLATANDRYAILTGLPEPELELVELELELVAAAGAAALELALLVELLDDDPHAASVSAVAARPATVATHPRERNRAVLLMCGSPSSASSTPACTHTG